jgi:hypothetical protein
MKTWIAALHKDFPGVQVAAVAADPNFIPGVSKRRATWDTDATAHGGAIFDGRSGLGAGKPHTVPLALTAAGTTLSAIQSAFHGATKSQALAFTGGPALGSTGAPALTGEAVTTPAGRRLVLVNASSRPVTLNLSSVLPGGFTATELAAPAVTTLIAGPSSVSTTTKSGTARLRVEPYALATIARR